MRGGLARRMCSDTENSIFPPSVVVVVIGKKLMWQTLQKTVPSFSSGPSTLCPLPGQRTIFGFVMDNRLPSNRTNAIGNRIVEMEGDCKGVGTTLSRQVARSPVQAGGYDLADQFKPRRGCAFSKLLPGRLRSLARDRGHLPQLMTQLLRLESWCVSTHIAGSFWRSSPHSTLQSCRFRK